MSCCLLALLANVHYNEPASYWALLGVSPSQNYYESNVNTPPPHHLWVHIGENAKFTCTKFNFRKEKTRHACALAPDFFQHVLRQPYQDLCQDVRRSPHFPIVLYPCFLLLSGPVMLRNPNDSNSRELLSLKRVLLPCVPQNWWFHVISQSQRSVFSCVIVICAPCNTTFMYISAYYISGTTISEYVAGTPETWSFVGHQKVRSTPWLASQRWGTNWFDPETLASRIIYVEHFILTPKCKIEETRSSQTLWLSEPNRASNDDSWAALESAQVFGRSFWPATVGRRLEPQWHMRLRRGTVTETEAGTSPCQHHKAPYVA